MGSSIPVHFRFIPCYVFPNKLPKPEENEGDVKKHHENPSVGSTLCKSKDKYVLWETWQMQLNPDVEAIFKFIGNRKEKLYEGYRPAHLICEDYLTSGVHSYYNLAESSDGEIEGTITFISPESYPACLWIGKEIKMYEGETLVGYAVIKNIFNPVLCKSD